MKLSILKGLHRGINTQRAEDRKQYGLLQTGVAGHSKQTTLIILRVFAKSNRKQSAFAAAQTRLLNYSMKVMHGNI